MPKGVVVNAGTATEYTRMEIENGKSESILLQGIAGYSKSTDPKKVDIHKFRFAGTQSLLKEDLPLSNNPREPGESKAVKAMKKTLEEKNKCGYFHLFNNGLTIIAKSLTHDSINGTVTLEFDHDKQGVCNGGHTYYAIKRGILGKYIKSEFFVNVEVMVLPKMSADDKKKLTILIAKARNFSNPIKPESLADAAGYFQPIKDMLGTNEHLLSYHENDSNAVEGAVPAKEFLRTLASLSPTLFSHDIFNTAGTNHKKASTNDKSAIWNPWVKENDEGLTIKLKPLYPLSTDVLKLRDRISQKMRKESSGTGGWKSQKNFKAWAHKSQPREPLFNAYGPLVLDLPVTLEPLLIGLLRNLVHIGYDKKKKPTLVGWYHDPLEWLDAGGPPDKLTHALNQMAPDMKNIDSVAFKTLSAPYEKHMIAWDLVAGQMPNDDPEIVYDIDDGTKYRRTKKGTLGTHKIDKNTGRMDDRLGEFNYVVEK
jgi:hypothetical protein